MQQVKEEKSKGKTFVIRTLAGAGLVVVLGVFVFLGGYAFMAFCGLLATLACIEFYKMYGMEKSIQGIYGYVMGLILFFLLATKNKNYIFPAIIFLFLLNAVMYVISFGKTDQKKTQAMFFGIFYTYGLFSFLYLLRSSRLFGIIFVGLLFLIAFGSDSFAYIFGMLFGKHKMTPVLSPKKSWEGFVGGILSAVVLCVIYGLIFSEKMSGIFSKSLPEFFKSPAVVCGIIGFVASIVSVFGDLFASAFKRENEIKDYSHIIPGHGGILDRFDSVLLAAPVVYYLLKFFTQV